MAPYTRGRKRFYEGKEEKSSSVVEIVEVKISEKKVAEVGHHHHGSSSSPPVEATTKPVGHHGSSSSPPVEATTKPVGHHGSSSSPPVEATTKVVGHHGSSSSPPVEATTRVVGHHGSSSSSPVEATTEKPKPRYRPTVLWMSEEEALRYGKQVEESEGFDVDKYFGRFSGYSMIRPLVLEDMEFNRELRKFCNVAIKHYKQNVSKDANFQFVRVVNANYRNGRYCDYYITFEARDAAANDQVKTLQAHVIVDYVGGEPVEVELCRLKPTPTPSAKKVIKDNVKVAC